VPVVVSIAALGGVSASYMAQAEVQSASGSLRRIQSRALAWSGVQAAMTELAQQRDAILRGERPQLTGEWELYADSAGRRAVVRIIATRMGDLATGEQTRLDVNTAGAEMLAALQIEEPLVQAIIAARDRRPFASIAELLEVEGMTPELLFGDDWDDPLPEMSDTPSLRGAPAFAGEGAGPMVLADRLTVFSFDPNVQAGLGPGGATHRGRLRINLNTPWSDRLAGAIEDRFGRPAMETARGIMASGIKIDSMGAMIRLAAVNNADKRAWPILFDVFTVVDDQYVAGLVNLNDAPAEILACIPGISSDASLKIVEARAQLSPESRQSVLWPLIENILSTEEMASAADHLTTRSSQWRLTVEGGFVRAEDRSSWAQMAGETLEDRVMLEAVIDIASERPRIAYLRDVTLRPIASRLASAIGGMSEEEPTGILDGLTEPVEQEAFGVWTEREPPAITIPEVPGGGPIEPDATEAGSMAGDQRIGRWTPGRVRKEEGR
jgi:DNA uptake protein ComE-like DNA-binding protein